MSVSLIPKLLTVKCTLTVVHDHLLGWDRLTGLQLNDSEDMKCFPYGLDINDESNIKLSTEHAGSSKSSEADYYSDTFGNAYGGAPSDSRDIYKAFAGAAPTPLFSTGATVESNYANQAQNFVTIVHIPTETRLHFKAFLTSLADNFSSKWGSERAYGRMDPIKIFQGTQRTMTISWDLIASNKEEGIENLRKCTNLIRMLYPTQTKHGSATSLRAPPMMAIKFTNLVSQGPADEGRGLTGTLNGFNFTPNLDVGFFEVESEESQSEG